MLPPPEIARKNQSGVSVRIRDSTASAAIAARPILAASSPQKRMPAPYPGTSAASTSASGTGWRAATQPARAAAPPVRNARRDARLTRPR
ncbi:MAG: hypothetical protein U1E59_10330 [Amaricoccus sp.]